MSQWLQTDAALSGLLDELVKIGQDADQKSKRRKRALNVLKTIGLASAGTAAGSGAAWLVEQHPAVQRFLRTPSPAKLWTARLGLPILGALATTLGARRAAAYKRSLESDS